MMNFDGSNSLANLNICIKLHVFKREVVDVIFYVNLFLLSHYIFPFFLRGTLYEISIFPEGGFFFPLPLEPLLVTSLVGWAVLALLRDVVVLGETLIFQTSIF